VEIISLEFFAFVCVSLLLYLLLPGRLQNGFLLLASYYFYYSWEWQFAAALLILTLFNFGYAIALHKTQKQRQKTILRLGILVNLTLWVLFLFSEPVSNLVNAILTNLFDFNSTITILLPLGFSYRVFESISYLVDIQLGLAKPSRNLIHFALYLGYFPKLVSGPIERARTFLPQLEKPVILDDGKVARNLLLVLTGLLRMVALAGLLLVLIPPYLFSKPLNYSSTMIVVGMMAFAFYLYNQFAGYTDLMRGISGFFGIELTRNFAQPFFSKDFSDFWRRWHISLSQWLRDYVYMPLSRRFLRRNPSRKNIPNLFIPPLITMLVSGFWHGGSLNLMLWGLLNGLFIIAENLVNLFTRTSSSSDQHRWRRLMSNLVVIALALLAAIPFRMDLLTSKVYLYGILKWNHWDSPDWRIMIIIALSLGMDWLQYRSDDEAIFLRWPTWLKLCLAPVALLAVIIVYNLQVAPATFVYP
jgi:alginate O-acetyltransferase complex protein AlgI